MAVGASRGGVADVFRRVIAEVRARGYAVSEVAVGVRPAPAWGGIAAALRSRHRLRSADIVHLEFGSNDTEVFWYALTAVMVRRDCVVVIHDYPTLVNHPAAGLLPRRTRVGRAVAYRVLVPALDRILRRLLLVRAGVIVVFGPEAREGWAAAGVRRVVEVTHGTEMRDPPLPPPSQGESVLFAGFLGSSKGVDTLLDAWCQIGDEVVLPLVLAGAAEEPWFTRALGDLGRFVRLPRILGPIPDERAFQDLIERAAIVVLPYRSSSPASGVFVRALAAGRAIVATPVPATRALRHGVNGVSVPIDDPGALARAIVELVRSPEERDRLGAAARETARTGFSWQRHLDGLEAAYGAAPTR